MADKASVRGRERKGGAKKGVVSEYQYTSWRLSTKLLHMAVEERFFSVCGLGVFPR